MSMDIWTEIALECSEKELIEIMKEGENLARTTENGKAFICEDCFDLFNNLFNKQMKVNPKKNEYVSQVMGIPLEVMYLGMDSAFTITDNPFACTECEGEDAYIFLLNNNLIPSIAECACGECHENEWKGDC